MARRQHLSTAIRSQRKGVVQKGWRSARASWQRNRRAELPLFSASPATLSR